MDKDDNVAHVNQVKLLKKQAAERMEALKEEEEEAEDDLEEVRCPDMETGIIFQPKQYGVLHSRP